MSIFTPTNTEVFVGVKIQQIFSFKGRKKNSTTYYTSMAKELLTQHLFLYLILTTEQMT